MTTVTCTTTTSHLLWAYTTATIMCLLLVTHPHPALSTGGGGRRARLEKLDPVDVLTNTGGGGDHQGPTALGQPMEHGALLEELARRLMEQGVDVNKPSVRYIMELYERLERGNQVLDTGGVGGGSGASSRDDRTEKGLGGGAAGTDTIRSITPTVSRDYTHHPELTLNFPLTGVMGYNGTTLAELRIRLQERHPAAGAGKSMTASSSRTHRSSRLTHRGRLQRVHARVLDSSGVCQVERVYRVKWWYETERDGAYRVFDITRILHDVAATKMERFQNGSLQIALRKTQRPGGTGSASSGARTSWEQQQHHPRSTETLFRPIPGAHDHPNTPAAIINSTNPSVSASSTPAPSAGDILLIVYAKSRGNFLDDEFQSRDSKRHFRSNSDHPRAKLKNKARRKQTTPATNSTLSITDHHVALRAKRLAQPTQKRKKKRCAVEDMFVDFTILGWADDIVYPVRYNAHTCAGKCPSPVDRSLYPTNHAILQSMMHMHDRKTRRPCCVPVTLKPLMMLCHRDKDKLQGNSGIEIQMHPDMVVQQCGCR